MSLSLGCHLGTITWDPSEPCSQIIPEPHSLVFSGCSPHTGKISSHLHSLSFPALSSPRCSLFPYPWSKLTAPTLQVLPSLFPRHSFVLGLFPEYHLHLPPELRMRSPQRTLLPLWSLQVEAAHPAKVQKLRSAFSSLPMTTSKPLHLHLRIKMHLLSFSCHLARSLKLTNCISFDAAIPSHTNILVQGERICVKISVRASSSTKKINWK